MANRDQELPGRTCGVTQKTTVHRHLELAIDDKQAANNTRRTFPEIKLWSTPKILKHWSEVSGLDARGLQEAIQLIETRSRCFPAKSHPLADWWQKSKESM
jgi:hypothetical protein